MHNMSYDKARTPLWTVRETPPRNPFHIPRLKIGGTHPQFCEYAQYD